MIPSPKTESEYPSSYLAAAKVTAGYEGGHADNPDDPGGETMRGVTEALARKHGHEGEMKTLTTWDQLYILYEEFWRVLGLTRIAEAYSQELAQELFDSAVLCGPRTAGKWLQRILNSFNKKAVLYDDLDVDGIIGPATLRALDAFTRYKYPFTRHMIVRKMNDMLSVYLLELTEQNDRYETFMWGWEMNRVQ